MKGLEVESQRNTGLKRKIVKPASCLFNLSVSSHSRQLNYRKDRPPCNSTLDIGVVSEQASKVSTWFQSVYLHVLESAGPVLYICPASCMHATHCPTRVPE
nr:PREDICTED: uncharacterized protein LOC107397767 [Tribolium castaneum]|eukprot:XP_015834651.1 PREDICTED: uncharacterized protein LOC107397767 [Tribolium castaneum]